MSPVGTYRSGQGGTACDTQELISHRQLLRETGKFTRAGSLSWLMPPIPSKRRDGLSSALIFSSISWTIIFTLVSFKTSRNIQQNGSSSSLGRRITLRTGRRGFVKVIFIYGNCNHSRRLGYFGAQQLITDIRHIGISTNMCLCLSLQGLIFMQSMMILRIPGARGTFSGKELDNFFLFWLC